MRNGKPTLLSRREFVCVAAAGSAVAGGGCSRRTSSKQFFTAAELRTLTALCDQIIPADEAPAASAAGVVAYISSQIVRHFKASRAIYREGLAAADRLAGGSFSNLPSAKQQQVIRQMERIPNLRPFIDQVIAHSMQGYYGSPRHGGNLNYASWRMLGIPSSPVRGRAHYELPRLSGEKG